MWNEPRVLVQKLTGPAYTATTSVRPEPLVPGVRAGLMALGRDYAYLALETTAGGTRVLVSVCRGADSGGGETEIAAALVDSPTAQLRLSVDEDAVGRFGFSRDGRRFEPLGEPIQLRGGIWVGARVGLVAVSAPGTATSAHADFDWFRVE